MFENIGWAEILVLVVAGLFILGPERLPEAARWLGSAIKQVRDYATGARDHLRKEFGPEFDEIQQPLNDLRGLRNFNPKTAINRTLFADDEPSVKPNGHTPPANGAPVTYGAAAAASYGAAAPAPNGSPAPVPSGSPAPVPNGSPAPVPNGSPAPAPNGSAAPVPNGSPAPAPNGSAAPVPNRPPAPVPNGSGAPMAANGPAGPAGPTGPPRQAPLESNERPPIDPDAT